MPLHDEWDQTAARQLPDRACPGLQACQTETQFTGQHLQPAGLLSFFFKPSSFWRFACTLVWTCAQFTVPSVMHEPVRACSWISTVNSWLEPWRQAAVRAVLEHMECVQTQHTHLQANAQPSACRGAAFAERMLQQKHADGARSGQTDTPPPALASGLPLWPPLTSL